MTFTPEATVYVGVLDDKYKIKDKEEVVLNYLLPSKQIKSILPFPIVFYNGLDVTLNKFYVELQTKAKPVIMGSGKGYMKRILSYSDYLVGERKEKSRLFYNEKSYDNQVVGNKENRIELNSGDKEEEIWALNVAGDSIISNRIWDTFMMHVEVGSEGSLRKFSVRINCYCTDDIDGMRNKIAKKVKGDSQNFILTPKLKRFAFNSDSLKVFIYGLEKSGIEKI